MKYNVHFEFTTHCNVEVEANSSDEAKLLAKHEVEGPKHDKHILNNLRYTEIKATKHE